MILTFILTFKNYDDVRINVYYNNYGCLKKKVKLTITITFYQKLPI